MDISVVYAAKLTQRPPTKRENAIYVRILRDFQSTKNKALRPLLDWVANKKYSFFRIW